MDMDMGISFKNIEWYAQRGVFTHSLVKRAKRPGMMRNKRGIPEPYTKCHLPPVTKG